ncbi:hypothetical protein CJF30_00010880 [Rutstroemia sp. NJR-2017a BBW]|nr:hypothetical protein CJF30_00010880 [Rutstroemia sp. NJR-2017a BBW]
MVLNATDISPEKDQALNNIDIGGIAGGIKSTLPIRDPPHYIQQLPPYPNNSLEHSRIQLPPVPSHRNLTPTYNDYHRRHDYLPSLVHYSYHSRTLQKSESTQSQTKKHYTEEEVDFIRYHKEDLSLHWEAIFDHFKNTFPNHTFGSNARLSSRYYRDNQFKQYDENDKVARDEYGNIMYLCAKVRGRGTPEGKEEGLPYTLVQRYPERGQKYTWVKEEHKEEMRKLALEMDDNTREIKYSRNAQKLRTEREARKTAVGKKRSFSTFVADGLESSSAGSLAPHH